MAVSVKIARKKTRIRARARITASRVAMSSHAAKKAGHQTKTARARGRTIGRITASRALRVGRAAKSTRAAKDIRRAVRNADRSDRKARAACRAKAF